HMEDRTVTLTALRPDTAAMPLHDLTGQVQAESQPTAGAISVARPKMPFKNMREIARRNTDAMVLHRHLNLVAGLTDRHPDSAADRIVFDCIIQQVSEDLLQPPPVPDPPDGPAATCQHQGVIAVQFLLLDHDLAQQRRQVKPLQVKIETVLLDAGQVEQLVHQPGHVIGSLGNLVRELRLSLTEGTALS